MPRKTDADLQAVIAANFIAFREATGLGQAEAARRMGVSNTTLWRIEQGEHSPSQATKVKAAKLYGRKVYEFEMPSPPPSTTAPPPKPVFMLKQLAKGDLRGLPEEEAERILAEVNAAVDRANARVDKLRHK